MITEADAEVTAMELEQEGQDKGAGFIRELHQQYRRALAIMPRSVREIYEEQEAREAAARRVRT